MSVGEVSVPAQRASGPGAKARILETVLDLFYEEGIRTVGVDRIIAEASVTKATFYKHYGSKDNLILQYIRERHEAAREGFETCVAAEPDPASAIRTLVRDTARDVSRPGFRGDAFLNAAAEFSDPLHPVRQVITAHRDWLTERLSDLLSEIGHPMPGDGADEIILARDGALSGGYAGDPVAASAALGRIAERVLDAARQ